MIIVRLTAFFLIFRKRLTGFHIPDYAKNYLIMGLEALSCYGLNIISQTDIKE